MRGKTKCPMCLEPMAMGRRAYVTISWERSARSLRDRVSTSSIVCRACATKLARKAKVEIPGEWSR